MERLRLALPSVGDEELAEIAKVLATGYLTQGPAVAQFESLVADYIGVEHAFATSSATTALHLSLAALGVGPKDEVVVPAFTFPATANVVVQLGARPVFADVDPATYAVTAASIEAAMSDRTAVVMPVDPFGYPAPMREIVALAQERGVRVVEDAACAIGAFRAGEPCGSFPDLGCFSFHPRKVITTGEGGMITTNDFDLAERITLLRNHGGKRTEDRYRYEAAGFNYRLSDVAGAIGIAQMAKLPGLLERRRHLAEMMTARLSPIDGVTPPSEEVGAMATYQAYVVMLDANWDRDKAIIHLRDKGIETTLGTYGLHLEPFFANYLGTTPEMFPNATAAAERSLTLPFFPDMSDDDVDRVGSRVEEVLKAMA